MSKSTNDISVVIPARNAADTIGEAISSVLSQAHVLEVIVINDGSKDDTASVIQAINNPRLRVLPGTETGISAALNTGFSAAHGRFIARCDADDWYPEGRFAHQRAFLEKHTDYVAICGGFATTDWTGRVIAELAQPETGREITSELASGRSMTSFCTWLVRAETLGEVGGARPWFETAEDADLQFRLAQKGRVWQEDALTYYYRLHDVSITHRSPQSRRLFFQHTARAFARQRLETGTDDLMRGVPPPIPDTEDAPSKAQTQIAGQLESAAWRAFSHNRKVEALRLMWRAILAEPSRGERWYRLAKMIGKTVLGHR